MAYKNSRDAGARFELVKACLSGGVNPRIIPNAMEFIDDGDISHLNGESNLKDLMSKSDKLKEQEGLYAKDIETLTKRIEELRSKREELLRVFSGLLKEYSDALNAGYSDIKESFKAFESRGNGFRWNDLVGSIPGNQKAVYVACNGALYRIHALRKDSDGRCIIDCREELFNLRELTALIKDIVDRLSRVHLESYKEDEVDFERMYRIRWGR